MSDYQKRMQWWRSVRNLGCICAACGIPATPAIQALAQPVPGFNDAADSSLNESIPDETEISKADPSGTADESEDNVEVSSFLTVDLHVQDTDLANVLKMLSLQSQKNIIVSRNVSATVTADLYDVTFYEALDAILNANGYGYREEGNFINVYTLDELRAIEDSERKVVHQRYELSYLNSADASVFITPLLSDDGSIAISGEVGAGIDPDTGDVGQQSWASSATIVVSDYAENVAQIGEMIKELDTRPQQVLVEATVLQTKLTEDNAWGVDWSIVSDVNFSDFTNPLSGVGDLLKGKDSGFQPPDNQGFNIGTNVGRVAGPGSLKIGIISDDISVFLRVLDEVSDTTVLSRPKILTLNRQRGEILIGAQIGYLNTTATQTSTTQTVEFLDTGTKLLFRPFIAKDGFVRMELAPSVSEGLIREITSAGGDAVTIPDRITQELTTNVVVRDGNTIVLGGLFREQTDLSRSQVPVLGDIPLIGAAFKGRSDSTEKQEIMFLITPTVMKDEYLDTMGQRAVDGVRRARLAVRSGTLWWSNERLTAQHNMRAEDFLRQGNNEMALWEIENSLSLHQNQPEVLRMKEEITGKRDRWFDREIVQSMMTDAVADHLAANNTDNAVSNDLSSVVESTPVAPVLGQPHHGDEMFDTGVSFDDDSSFDESTYLELGELASPESMESIHEGPGSITEIPTTFEEPSQLDDSEMNSPVDPIAESGESSDDLSVELDFDFQPGTTYESENGASINQIENETGLLEFFSTEIATTDATKSQNRRPFLLSAKWLSFQRFMGIDFGTKTESSQLAEAPTDIPEGIK